nr:unnamed protein product [Digitaria exilis]
MEARNGGHERWSYIEQAIGCDSHSIASSSIGTISTSYASSGSHMSPVPVESAMFEEDVLLEESESKTKRLQLLVQEFSAGAPPSTVDRSVRGGDMSVVERWLTELGVGWVLLHAADAAASSGKPEHTFDARWRSWVRALAEIVESIRSTALLFADPRRGSVTGLAMIREEEEAGHVKDQSEERAAIPPPQFLPRGLTNKLLQSVVNKLLRSNSSESLHLTSSVEEEEESSIVPDQLHFARFFQETMLGMLAFVDVLASEVAVRSGVAMSPYEKLSALLGVRFALSKALPQVRFPSNSPRSAQVDRVQGDMVSLLSTEEGKVGEAAWSTMEEIWTGIQERLEEEDGTRQITQRSSGVHKVTLSVVTYIRFLRANYWTVAPIVSSAACHGKFVPRFRDVPPLTSLIIEMASCIEEKLADSSEWLPDQSLRVEGYMESYLKSMWH